MASSHQHFHSSRVHPSLLPGVFLPPWGRFQSVCLLMTPLGTDVILSSCCSSSSSTHQLFHPHPRISLRLPSDVSCVLIYLHSLFIFSASFNHKLASLIVFLFLFRLLRPALSNSLHFPVQLLMFKACCFFLFFFVITIVSGISCVCLPRECQLSHCNHVKPIPATDGSFF